MIVQVKDHRGNKTNNSSSGSESKGTNVPLSIHNYEQWVTPSPYMPFPEQKRPENDPKDASIPSTQLSSSKEKDKSHEPKIYTVVLFPTAQSIQEEAFIQANTPDARQGNRKGQGTNVPRTPASGTVPPTPLSAIPPTPSASVPPAKRQKMSISGAEIQGFESKIIAATAPPLFLDPVADLGQANEVLESLTGPLHREKLPSPKTRKRTVAELAADERIAAQEQAFMLIMDEKANTAGKSGANDEDGAAPFEPSFETLNAIQNIKNHHNERARLIAQQQKKHEVEMKRLEQTAKVNRQHKDFMDQQEMQQKKAMALKRQNDLVQRQRLTQNTMAHAQVNGSMPNGYPPGPQSPPMQRIGTPHSNPSPTPGQAMGSQIGGVPMQHTSSGQGSSPGRPPSSMRQSHPGAAVQMLRDQSRQNPSRTSTPPMNGTPHMANVTPSIPHSTPIIGQGTPVSRMSQASPPNVMQTSIGQPMNVPQGMSTEQYTNSMRENQRQQAAFLQQQQAMHNQQQRAAMQQLQMQQNGQMSPQGTGAHNMQQQIAMQQRQAAMRAAQNAAAAGMQQHQGMPNGASPGMPQHQNPGANHLGQQQPNQPRPIAQVPQQQGSNAFQQHQQKVFQQELQRVMFQITQQNGGNPPVLNQQQKQQAQARAMDQTNAIIQRMKLDNHNKSIQNQQQAQIENTRRMMGQRQQGGMPMGQGINGMGNPQMAGMRQGQQMTREMAAQYAQMQHFANSANMNGMGGMNGMNGMQ
ncbi:uncharacterized protein KY384_006643 [Bacidia gigantensis]|uniref:uncharacterized protein n=1 Tax=Bacidia gigantensis TaxID=2732470 RepID=UPI001D05988E|nr:uncharacterized protein KY384_006643 [Bacidia gigantensis]KAG8528954.1 hypothetical protein KY384_006643 [Bacidia gigantensis]